MSNLVSRRQPRRVAIVGAGMVGLSTAWFLQEYGVEVTVLDRAGVAAGASRGNAGWLTPSIATPLPAPGVLEYGLRAVFKPSSPVYVPPSANPRLLRFLARFARNSTQRRWTRAMAALTPLNRGALEAFSALESAGLTTRSMAAEPFIIAFRDRSERDAIVEEFDHIRRMGQPVGFDLLDDEEARAAAPALSREIQCVLRLHDQRFIDPAAFVTSLGEAVVARGGSLVRETVDASGVDADDAGVRIGGNPFDAVVFANGARLGDLARSFGVRRIVQPGRGYSFSVKAESLPEAPLYFPAARVACTPIEDRLRVAGMMEFRPDDAPLDPRRIDAIVSAVGDLLDGLHLDDRNDEWVGSRPCTADGLPLIGRTRHQRVYVAGGHGMWGITLGPVTGQLLAEQITSGQTPAALHAVHPLR